LGIYPSPCPRKWRGENDTGISSPSPRAGRDLGRGKNSSLKTPNFIP
jgi:hypothetical protein